MSIPAQTLILLPVDGSESSARAAEYAVWFARISGGRLLVLNVQPEIEDWQTHGLGHEAAARHRADLAAQKSAGALALCAGTPHEFLVEFGEPAETIGRVAKDKECTAVVMGTRGLGKVAGVLMGSVAMKTFHVVKVPITFVQ